jgi:outer membrane cobalamin receptor
LIKRQYLFCAIILILAAWGHPHAAFAQKVTLDTVNVNGRIDPISEVHGRLLEKASVQLMHIISRQSIEQAADVTVADAMQRVSGVSVLRNETGIPGRVIIRGMDPKYSHAAVNGMAIPSPDPRHRYLSLDLFPSGIIDHLEVYKTLTPAITGDAIGGRINIVTRPAPKQQELSIQLTTGHSEFYFNRRYLYFDNSVVQTKSPYERYGPTYYSTGKDFTKDNLHFATKHITPDMQGSVTWGKRFLSQKLGILMTAGVQTTHTGSNGFLILQNNEPQIGNIPGITDFIKRIYYETNDRKQFYATLDYKFNEQHKLRFYQLYLHKQETETRSSVDTSLSEGRTGPGTGRIAILQRSLVARQSIEHLNLQGDHQLGTSLSLDWSGVYSIALGNYPDRAELTANTGRILGANGVVQQTPVLLAPLERIWMHNKEQESDVYVNLHYKPVFLQQGLELSGGTLLKYRQRDNFFNSYIFNPAITSGNGQPFSGIYDAVWLNNNGPQNPLGTVNTAGTYTARENITAFYVQAAYQKGPLYIMAGVREEHTEQHVRSAANPGTFLGKEIAIRYKDWLPSMSLRYALNAQQDLKLSWYEALSRPSLYDITFFNMNYDDYNIAGNPFLKRSTADNFDLRYELYQPGILEVLQATVFYKRIENPYEKTLLSAADTLYPIPANGLSYIPAAKLTEQLRNYGIASNYGIELSIVKQWNNIGVHANYTFTSSHIEQTRKYKQREDPKDVTSDIVTVTRTQERPLQGQSKHIGSLGLSYRLPRYGWYARLQGTYTGKRIDEVSGWYDLDNWQRAYTALDFTIEKTVGTHWRFFAKATNLLNAGTEIYVKATLPDIPEQMSPRRTLVEKEVHGRGMLLGVQYRMR